MSNKEAKMDDELLNKAIIFAVNAHAGMKRKGTNTPYIVHPMEAAAIVASMTDDREVIAAAVLHDVVEDTEYTVEDIKKEFGDRVASLVASESEDKRSELPEEETWKVRKEETLEHLKNASIETKMITLGDKLSNIRAIYKDYLKLDDKLWERFNQKDKNEHAWYYSSIADLLSDLEKYPAWRDYKDTVNAVFKLYDFNLDEPDVCMALEVALWKGEWPICLIQNIGCKSKRWVAHLTWWAEENGLIGPDNGTKPREIYFSSLSDAKRIIEQKNGASNRV